MGKGEVRKKQIQYYSYCIGALLFLMFGKLIGNNGIVYLAIAMETMSLCMVLLGDGVADAYSKMLRIRRKRGQYFDALIVTRRIRVIQCVLAILFSVLIFVMADSIALKLFQMPKAALVIRILTPVLFLRMIGTLLIGYFQSFGAYSVIGIIYILRQILFWLLGSALCKNRMAYGEKVAGLLKNSDYVGMYGAIGLAIAIVITEVIVLTALIIYYFLVEHNYDKKKMDRNLHMAEPLGVTLRNYTYLSSNHVLLGYIKRILVIVPFILLISNVNDAGVFYGKFLVLCSIPVLLLCSRYALLYSRLCSLIRNKDNRMTRENIQTGILYTWSVSLLVAVLFSVMAPQISDAFFAQDAVMKSFLQYGSVLIVAVTMLIYLSIVHIAHNRKIECFGTLIFTVILNLILSKSMYSKSSKPETLILSSVISLFIGALILTALAVYLYNLRMEYIPIYVLPLICVGVSGVIVLLMTKSMTPHIGSTISCFIGVILGTVLYVAALSLCRVFSDQEVERIYGSLGRKLFSFIFK